MDDRVVADTDVSHLADQVASLDPKINPNIGRRFAVTSLAVGFAMAVRPVNAATITTDANGLTAGEVQITVTDGKIPGYRAMPAGDRGDLRKHQDAQVGREHDRHHP